MVLKNIRPITPIEDFNEALKMANLSERERQIIEHIRFIGTFTQPSLTQALRIDPKPPALSSLCEACRKIGSHMPKHFEAVRKWSEKNSPDKVRWDGDLICSTTLNIDGERLTPEAKTAQFHNFAVHKELFLGFD